MIGAEFCVGPQLLCAAGERLISAIGCGASLITNSEPAAGGTLQAEDIAIARAAARQHRWAISTSRGQWCKRAAWRGVAKIHVKTGRAAKSPMGCVPWVVARR